jgi:hypothetical protein
MMARQFARQFYWLGEVHSLAYRRRASGKNGRKLTPALAYVNGNLELIQFFGIGN